MKNITKYNVSLWLFWFSDFKATFQPYGKNRAPISIETYLTTVKKNSCLDLDSGNYLLKGNKIPPPFKERFEIYEYSK